MALTDRQRELRRGHLGASLSPTLLGHPPVPSLTASQVYYRIVEPLGDDATEAMRLGDWLEIPLCQWIGERIGKAVTRRNAFRVSGEEPILSATIDAFVDDESHGECKYVGRHNAADWGPDGSDQIPASVMIQVQHQMFVLGTRRCYVAAAIAGYQLDRRLYVVERHERLIAAMLPRLVAWWNAHVVPRIPPGDDEPPPLDVLACRERVPGKSMVLAAPLVRRYQQLGYALDALGELRERTKAELIAALGDAEIGEAVGYSITYKSQKSSPRVDHARLRADGLWETYCSQGEHRVLRISGGKGESQTEPKGTQP